MEKLNKIRFDNFIKLQRGFDLPDADIIDGEYPVVASTSIKAYHNQYKVEPPAVVTGRSGSLGSVQYITEKCWPLNTSLYVKDFKGHNPKYVFYFLQTMHLEQYNAGAGVPTLNQNHLHSLKIMVHSLPTQQKIASILSAYDNLIQNYKKQIEDLQTTASELYKEWFVRFRFPGYKTTQFENGIPVGWKVEKVGDHCNVFTGKKDVNQTVEDGKYAFFSCSPDTFYSNDYIYDGKAILVAGNGSYTGRTRFFEGKFDLYQRTYAITTGKQNLIEYLYWIFKTDFETRFTGGTRGAAIPYIVMGDITKYKFLYEESLVKKFIESVIPMNKKIDTLQQQITNLTQQRDLLLPRLMSGKLEVE